MRTLRITLILPVLLIAILFLSWRLALNSPLIPEGTEPILFRVSKGESAAQIRNHLAQLVGMPQATIFYSLVRLFRVSAHLQAGVYDITPQINILQFTYNLTYGYQKKYYFTIQEGWTNAQIIAALNKQIPDFILDSNFESASQKEAQWFPATYEYFSNTSAQTILKNAYDKQNTVLSACWEARDLNPIVSTNLKTSEQALILASIIEKETHIPAERKIISGVFHKRLTLGIPLQADPTIIYALGEQFTGTLKKTDLKFNSKYNTYLYAGLPPGAIGSPGFESLWAALHPDLESGYLYFVFDSKTGSHLFSKTLAEHESNIEKIWQINRL